MSELELNQDKIISLINFLVRAIAIIVTYTFIIIGIVLIYIFTYEKGCYNKITKNKINRVRFFYGLKKKLLIKYPKTISYLGLYQWFKKCSKY